MEDLQKLMNDIQDWSDSTFGEAQRTVPILHHLKKEVKELVEASSKYDAEEHPMLSINARADMEEEFADCFMLLLDAASHVNIDAGSLIVLTREKLNKNKLRKWGKPDENGVVEHIKE